MNNPGHLQILWTISLNDSEKQNSRQDFTLSFFTTFYSPVVYIAWTLQCLDVENDMKGNKKASMTHSTSQG